MGEKITEIDRKDLTLLKALYISNGPKHFTTCITIDNYIRCFQQNSNVNDITFFCLNGDFSDGTFIVVVRTFFVFIIVGVSV